MACRMSTAAAVATALALNLAGLPAFVDASAFRGSGAVARHQALDLLEELGSALGAGRRAAAEARVGEFEDAMRPIFRSMPHSDDGRLPASGVRYLLHRVFVERHGWFVEGLTNGGEAWNSSSPTSFFSEHVGSLEAQIAFERRLGEAGGGLSLRETAVFAATLESLVHEETLERLHSTYRVLNLDQKEESGATERETEKVIDTYMLMLVLGLNHTDVAPDLVSRATNKIEQIYPNWHQVEKWVREVRKEVVSAVPESRTAFATTAKVLEEVADRYGRWQDAECIALKDDLVQIEKDGTGRVPLKDFYGAALNGSYQFTEKREYLRQLGALDESRPWHPSVIIPNYINSASNCLASSKFYSVCCINECESLLKPLERHIAAPDATPERILELVERLPSSTVDAPRKLSPSLVNRLEEIAEKNEGRVPLHGRLFALWMHHAYPRECPYPHAAGTTTQATMPKAHREGAESVSHRAEGLRAEVEVCRQADAAAASISKPEPLQLPWTETEHEELFVAPLRPPRSESSSGGIAGAMRAVAMVAAAGSLGMVTFNAAGPAIRALGRKDEKYLV